MHAERPRYLQELNLIIFKAGAARDPAAAPVEPPFRLHHLAISQFPDQLRGTGTPCPPSTRGSTSTCTPSRINLTACAANTLTASSSLRLLATRGGPAFHRAKSAAAGGFLGRPCGELSSPETSVGEDSRCRSREAQVGCRHRGGVLICCLP